MKSRLPRRGFTLVELLVVMGIIALLVAILMPSLRRARQQANLVTCQSNLRQIGIGVQMYANANRGSLPTANYTYSNGEPGAWYFLIGKYLGVKDYTTKMSPLLTDVDSVRPTYEQWWFDQEHPLTYSAHAQYFNYYPGTSTKPYKLGNFRRSSERAIIWDAPQFGNYWGDDKPGVYQATETAWMMGDTQGWTITWLSWPLPDWYLSSHPGPDAGANTDPANRYEPFPGATSDNDYGGQWRFRHNNNRQANFLFADGHVAAMERKYKGFGGSDLKWENIWWIGMDQ